MDNVEVVAAEPLANERTATSSRDRLATFAFVAGTAVTALAAGSWTHLLPERDAGVFLYVAGRLRDGAVPYRDVWDHKPPAAYVLDALALVLTRDPLLAARAVEAAALVSAALIGFVVAERWTTRRAALFATCLWVLAAAALIEGGNGVEVLALPVQFGALWFALKARARHRDWILVGILLGLVILVKFNLVAIWLAIITVLGARALAARSATLFLRPLAAIAAGAVLVIGPAVALLGAAGALPDAIDQVVIYNAAYANVTWADRVASVLQGARTLGSAGILLIGALGWGLAVTALARHRAPAGQRDLLPILSVALPLEVALVAFSGRDYPHYYLSWLPSLGLLAAFAYVMAAARLRRRARSGALVETAVLAGALVWTLAFDARIALGAVAFQSSPEMRTRLDTIDYVATHSAPSDPVVIWGAESVVNTLAQRRIAGRFAYSYPLFTLGYQQSSAVAAFLPDLKVDPPALIIDASIAADGLVEPLSRDSTVRWRAARSDYGEPPDMEQIRLWITTNYTVVAVIGPERWTVYRRR